MVQCLKYYSIIYPLTMNFEAMTFSIKHVQQINIYTHIVRMKRVITNHRNAILIGVVRQEVKTSAGKSELCGRVSFGPQAASRMQSFDDSAGELEELPS